MQHRLLHPPPLSAVYSRRSQSAQLVEGSARQPHEHAPTAAAPPPRSMCRQRSGRTSLLHSRLPLPHCPLRRLRPLPRLLRARLRVVHGPPVLGSGATRTSRTVCRSLTASSSSSSPHCSRDGTLSSLHTASSLSSQGRTEQFDVLAMFARRPSSLLTVSCALCTVLLARAGSTMPAAGS